MAIQSWLRHQVLRLLLKVAIALCSINALGAVVLAASRSQLPYNEEGRYFDADVGIVYHQQTEAFLWAAAFFFTLLTISFWVGLRFSRNA